jgi:hypothetical protein
MMPPRERRRAPRVARDWSVEIKNGSARRWAGRSVDVSTSGMRLRIETPPIEIRGLMFISFDPCDQIGPFWTGFSLVRDIGECQYAIKYLDLPAKAIERLARLLDV